MVYISNMLESESKDLCRARPPRSARHTPLQPKPPSPQLDCISFVSLKPVSLKLRSRPPSPCNVSLCSTRSSSSTRTIKRSVSVSEQRRDNVESQPVPCSAKAWAVINGKTGKVLLSKSDEDIREIASLTKIMTLYTALQMLKELDISLTSIVTVSFKAANMNGTSARLQPGDHLKLIDLMHGMMLPSGNDAAQCIAEFMGKKIAEHKAIPGITKDHDKLFIREMNQQAEKLRMRKTFYQNPHGMSIKRNHSTARDVSILASIAMRLTLFRSIVNTQMYSCRITDKRGDERVWTWENTNKMLQKGYEGVKTGVTDAAGPCLCASWKEGETRIIVTLLGSKTMEERWEEVPRLVAWARGHLS